MSERANRCHWIKDKDCPNGRFWMPYCYSGAMADGECDCPKIAAPRHTRAKPAEALDIYERVERLEREVASMRALLAPEPSHAV